MSQTEMAIVNQIDYGSHPLMPAFRYKLANDDILRLAVYVRSFAGRTGSAQPLASPGGTSHITAANVYGTYCFACHDTTGKGNSTMRLSMPEIPDFTLTKWQQSRTDAELAHSILHGKGKFMLPMTDKLGSVDVKQMVALVRKFYGRKADLSLCKPPKAPGPPAPMVVTAPTSILSTPGGAKTLMEEPLVAASGDLAARIRIGASIFQQYCIVCHGPDGTGSVMRPRMPPIPDFTSPVFQNGHSDARLQISILDGKGSLMPANRGRVTDDQAADLKDFIRAFRPEESRRHAHPAVGYAVRQGVPPPPGTVEFARESIAKEMIAAGKQSAKFDPQLESHRPVFRKESTMTGKELTERLPSTPLLAFWILALGGPRAFVAGLTFEPATDLGRSARRRQLSRRRRIERCSASGTALRDGRSLELSGDASLRGDDRDSPAGGHCADRRFGFRPSLYSWAVSPCRRLGVAASASGG